MYNKQSSTILVVTSIFLFLFVLFTISESGANIKDELFNYSNLMSVILYFVIGLLFLKKFKGNKIIDFTIFLIVMLSFSFFLKNWDYIEMFIFN